METASVVLSHEIDDEILQEITSLRMIRLSLAERLLADLEQTVVDLKKRGLTQPGAKDVDRKALRQELLSKVVTLRGRMDKKDVVYADEIEFYLNLIKADA